MNKLPPILSFAEDPPAGAARMDLDRLVSSRLLAQANSGAGKSTLLRALLEQTHGRVQHVVLDPEGEFGTLRERFDYLLAGQGADVPARPESAALLCRRVMELGGSLIADLYDLPLPDRRRFVRRFLEEMMSLPRELWRPCLVVIDESHVFCPEAGGAESADAVITLCTQGRKRGFAAVLATQRLSKLHKDAAAELLNKLIGRTGLDVDLRRAADDLGFTKDQAAALKTLSPGQFYAYGPAISSEVALVQAPKVLTTLPAAGAVAAFAPPPASEAIAAIAAQMRDLPQEAEAEARDIETLRTRNLELQKSNTELKRQIREKATAQAAPVVERVEVERVVEKTVEVPVLGDEDRQRLEWIIYEMEKRAEGMSRTAGDLLAEAAAVREALGRMITHPEQATPAAVPTAPNNTKQAESITAAPQAKKSIITPAAGTPKVSRPQQAILDALAGFEALGVRQPKRPHVALFADVSPNSSAYTNNLGALRTAGLIDYPAGGLVTLTGKGRGMANAPASPPTLAGLQRTWISRLTGPQGRILEALIGVYPRALSREALASLSGASFNSSAFSNNLGALRSLGLVDYPDKGAVAASALVFPEGLR